MGRKIHTIFFAVILIGVSVVGAYSQTMGDAIERVRAIKFLETEQSEVRLLLHEMIYDGSFGNRDDFTYGTFDIEVYYSTGECDEYEDEIFQTDAGKAVRIVISSSDDFKIGQLEFDLSKLKKEQKYRDNETSFIYHDKKIGLAVDVDEDEVEEVILFPSFISKSKHCGNDKAREFMKMKSWFGSTKLEDRTGFICIMVPANVTSLELSETEITALTPKRVSISTTAFDAENDVLTSVYIVSAGRIIGPGPKVVWDVTGVPPGIYTITAGVGDGCGICGSTVTKTVTIK